MIIKCEQCGQKNRVPGSRLSEGGKCGKCSAELSFAGKPHSVKPADLDDLIANSPVPVLVDFWAPWCGPCRMVAPELEKLAQRQGERLLVIKLNTQDHPEVASREGVRGIPMFALYDGGERQCTEAGYMSAEALESRLGLAV